MQWRSDPHRGLWQARQIGLFLLAMLVWSLVVSQWANAATGGLDMKTAPWEQPRLAQRTYPQQPASPWTFRPQSPTNARGVPPASVPGQQPPAGYPAPGTWQRPYSGTYPGQNRSGYQASPGYYPYQQGTSTFDQPSLEVTLFETQPYVQQPMLVRLDVISSGNLATASPKLAGFDALLLEEISGPATSVRGSGRTQQIVNSYLLAMTPLRAGMLEVGPFEVSGTLAGGMPFSAKTSSPSPLEVRPVVASVRPWLPLRALQLTRELDETAPLAEGRPTTLTLRMEGTGGVGTQLPDLEAMLRSDNFRAYREQTIVETQLSADETKLQGVRTEIYTLVPYSGGRLQLPALRVDWWNVETARRESSSVPIRSLSVAGESGPFGFGRGSGWLSDDASSRSDDGFGRKDKAWPWFWIPLGSVLLLLIGYWAGVWYRVRGPGSGGDAQAAHHRSVSGAPIRQRLGGGGDRSRSGIGTGTDLRNGLKARLKTRLKTGLARLDPRAPAADAWQRLRARLRDLLPANIRVYRCAIEAEQADSASEWALRFQSSACQSLRTPSREPLPRMADRILRLRPGADEARVRSLIQELDTALYNGAELDMRRWKRELRRALRPGWGALRGLVGNRFQRRRLPALNPRSSGS
ncbi:hypothetical protein [Halochromatium sp.]